ncbi:unnamed protein product [Pocillopora meandrina]|uniref:Uncharacterized protein n=1 Tax=Pocillopora meandrina TaxID=46732 RepID=A0AAU9XHG2_9CNID|nr:unnamed protein product [Pocillopora meandrina]
MSEANNCFTDIDIGVEREGIDAATPGSGLCNDSALASKTNRSFAAEQTECGTLYERTKMSYERTRTPYRESLDNIDQIQKATWKFQSCPTENCQSN